VILFHVENDVTLRAKFV